MKFLDCGREESLRLQMIMVTCLLTVSKPIDAKTRISNFYRRFIRNTEVDTEEKNFIEKIHNSTVPVYNHYILSTTELLGLNPSCAKLCPKGIVIFSIPTIRLKCNAVHILSAPNCTFFNFVYTLSFTVVDVNNEKIGCSVGTEETLKEDGQTAKTMAHPLVLEAQYGVVKVILLYIRC